MIETGRALEALDDILAVEGIDGVFMGPSDLSLTLSAGKSIAPTEKSLDEPIARIAERARAVGKIAGAFAVNTERAAFFRDVGYRLIALGTDQIYLATGIAAMLAPLAREA
jgi:4-hydroxy-2-oxoheptanedioate aldolase